MILAEVLHLLLEDRIEETRHEAVQDGAQRLAVGKIDGYEACRDMEPGELSDLLTDAAVKRVEAVQRGHEDIEYRVGYETAVEFVASVMSCALQYHGLPTLTRITPKARAAYAGIVGYERSDATKNRHAR